MPVVGIYEGVGGENVAHDCVRLLCEKCVHLRQTDYICVSSCVIVCEFLELKALHTLGTYVTRNIFV